jgi:hypothetical protein
MLILDLCTQLVDRPHERSTELWRIEVMARPFLVRLRSLFASQLASSDIHDVSQRTPALVATVSAFIQSAFEEQSWQPLESRVLDFCLREAVTPQDMVAVLLDMTIVPEYFAAVEKLTKNLSLNCIIQANRLLW